jgi:hypothetical protein
LTEKPSLLDALGHLISFVYQETVQAGLNEQLFKAAELGSTNNVGKLLSIGAEVNAKVIFVMIHVMP